MRILIFGDSITYGEYDSHGGWADRLKIDYFRWCAEHPGEDSPLVYNLGIGGDVAAHLAQRLPGEVDARRSLWSKSSEFTLVFAIGINDSLIKHGGNGEVFSTPEKYARDLEVLYELAHKVTDRILFVGLTPIEPDKLRSSNLYVNDRIWQFEQVLRDFAKQKGVPHVPLFETLKERIDKGEQLYIDGLHPNDEGHQLMYEQIKPALDKVLGE